jgi:hypothetical protein
MLSSDSTTCLQPHALVWFQPQRLLCRERVAGDQVGEAVVCPVHLQPVSIHLLWMSGEIRHHEKSLTAAVTDVAEEMPVAGLNGRCVTIVHRAVDPTTVPGRAATALPAEASDGYFRGLRYASRWRAGSGKRTGHSCTRAALRHRI